MRDVGDNFPRRFAASRDYEFEESAEYLDDLSDFAVGIQAELRSEVTDLSSEWNDPENDFAHFQQSWDLKVVRVRDRYRYLQIAECDVNRRKYRLFLCICPDRKSVVILGAWMKQGRRGAQDHEIRAACRVAEGYWED